MTTIKLNINHSEKKRVEAFLRILNEKLEQISYDWESLEESSRIVDAAKLVNSNKSLTITIIFVESYDDANLIAKANFVKEEKRWGQNGSIMYLAESSDEDKVAKVLSTFAGEE